MQPNKRIKEIDYNRSPEDNVEAKFIVILYSIKGKSAGTFNKKALKEFRESIPGLSENANGFLWF